MSFINIYTEVQWNAHKHAVSEDLWLELLFFILVSIESNSIYYRWRDKFRRIKNRYFIRKCPSIEEFIVFAGIDSILTP